MKMGVEGKKSGRVAGNKKNKISKEFPLMDEYLLKSLIVKSIKNILY